MNKNTDIFHFSENADAVILVGAYRSDKNQYDWITGVSTGRFENLYNVRLNESLFTVRDGGISSSRLPDYILLYDCFDLTKPCHLFPCVSASKRTEEEMQALGYPKPKGSYYIYLLGDEILCDNVDVNNLTKQLQRKNQNQVEFAPLFVTGNDIIPFSYLNNGMENNKENQKSKQKALRFIDLFAGIGGIRCGLEQAAREIGLNPVCVFTSEIKPYAVKVLKDNHPTEVISGDITKISTKNIPDFDILCAGFPCQAFSAAGKRQGFADTRGTLFFEVERILREKQPQGFILENVEGLVNHDGGKTLDVIVEHLSKLDYKFDFRVLNSKYFGVPQERKRIYIVGARNCKPDLNDFPKAECTLSAILEHGKPTITSPFINSLLKHYSIEELYGKSIKDKRGGDTNIHSWDLEIKGSVSVDEKQLLDTILTERRKKKWAEIIGIDWMDGMPLTLEQIKSFYDVPTLQTMLEDLTDKGYLKFEHPKKLVKEISSARVTSTRREYDTTKPKGYNIVTGKLSFEINKVLSPDEIAPTLVAMDMQKLYVSDGGGLRRLTLREGLRLCGYPNDMKFDVKEKEGFDLLGNTVVVPVIKAVASRLLQCITI